VAPELERLRVKAVAKAREYLMARIYALRKPKTNIQILQQNMLLRFRYLVTFLRAHGPEVFGEVRPRSFDNMQLGFLSSLRNSACRHWTWQNFTMRLLLCEA